MEEPVAQLELESSQGRKSRENNGPGALSRGGRKSNHGALSSSVSGLLNIGRGKA